MSMSNVVEIEIKSLLGSPDCAKKLRNDLKKVDPAHSYLGKHKQLNHYFEEPRDHKLVQGILANVLETIQHKHFTDMCNRANSLSIRTRDADGTVLFVAKASIGDGTSANATSREEFEVEVPNTTIHDLDDLLIQAGLEYQAKWSREREEYKSGKINITIDRNAGYGYLAEFERVIEDPSQKDIIREELMDFMDQLELEELPQDRLERMFAYYNAHWQDYYGTEEIFVIE